MGTIITVHNIMAFILLLGLVSVVAVIRIIKERNGRLKQKECARELLRKVDKLRQKLLEIINR